MSAPTNPDTTDPHTTEPDPTDPETNRSLGVPGSSPPRTRPGPWTSLSMVGPVAFAALFALRAVNPFDAILVTISIALVVTTVALAVGVRAAGWLYLIFPIAVFTSPAIRELSFNLSAVDSSRWRWHSIISLVALGLATVTALAVALRGAPTGRRSTVRQTALSTVGGLALGALMLAAAPALADEPGFGRDLTEAELAALPTIDLLNYRYEAATITVEPSGVQRFRLDNPSSAPHTVTIDALDLEVWVPPRRWAVLEFDAGQLSETVAFYCSVGDHRDLGMSGILAVG